MLSARQRDPQGSHAAFNVLTGNFVSFPQSETILLDLKHLLKEAKQRVPPVLDALDDPMERLAEMQATSGQKGCTFCGGLGHRIADCPKLRLQAKQNARGNKDYLGKGGFGAEM